MKKLKEMCQRVYAQNCTSENELKDTIILCDEYLCIEGSRRIALQLIGYSYFLLNNLKKSFDIYNTLIEEDIPDFNAWDINVSRTLEGLRPFYIDLSKTWEEIFILKDKLTYNSSNKIYFKKIGVNYLSLGIYKTASRYYEKYLEYESTDYEYWYYLSEIYRGLYQFQKVLRCYETIMKLECKFEEDLLGIFKSVKKENCVLKEIFINKVKSYKSL